jgi:hypothetical protein
MGYGIYGSRCDGLFGNLECVAYASIFLLLWLAAVFVEWDDSERVYMRGGGGDFWRRAREVTPLAVLFA